MEQPLRILRERFGYHQFRHQQEAIIGDLLAGRDVLTLMPTGGGKSICYQIPALLRPGVGIVVSPLIALMQDQVDALQQLGIRAAFLNSTLDARSRGEVEQALLDEEIDLLYVAPERLLAERMLGLIDRSRIALFAIDEAHCVSQWGHDFRREYQQLRMLHQRWPETPRIALTATADPRTRDEIIEQLDLHRAAIHVNSFDRPNIRYTIADGTRAKARLWQFIQQQHPEGAGIVYCLSRKRCEETAAWLSDQGRQALPYHAGLPGEERRAHQQRFLREEGLIICATIAFGMGIDKPDVRFVAHLGLPKSIEAYYQETGRAGRDGEPANAWMAYGLQDVTMLRQFVQGSDAEEAHKRVQYQKLEAMLSLCEQVECRRQSLLAYFGETLEEPCGNCDNCLSPPVTWDATEDARKALSCVYRTGEGFGVNYVTQILLGSADERILRNGHDRISTFGIGQSLKANRWRTLFRQLIARDYLASGDHGALRLTDRCRPLLRGEATLHLRQEAKAEPRERGGERSGRRRSSAAQLLAFEEPLFEALRALRSTLAAEQGVPPYVIFHDSTLMEMIRCAPDSLEQMGAVSGVGESKLSRYGEAFLALLREHSLPELLRHPFSDTVKESLYLYEQGVAPAEIARQRSLQEGTIYNHLSEAIDAGLLDARETLALEPGCYEEIVAAMGRVEACEKTHLKPLHEALDGRYHYGVLRCVVVAEQREPGR